MYRISPQDDPEHTAGFSLHFGVRTENTVWNSPTRNPRHLHTSPESLRRVERSVLIQPEVFTAEILLMES